MPIWATSNYSEVTKFWNGSYKISDKYDDIVAGSRKSGGKKYFYFQLKNIQII